MQKYIYLIIFFLLLLALAVGGLLYLLRRDAPPQATQIMLSVLAPESVTSGDEVAFTVQYRNATKTSLREAELVFHYPPEAFPLTESLQRVESVSLGTLAPGVGGSQEFRAFVVGPKHSTIRPSVELRYKSGSGDTPFEKRADMVVQISQVPFYLNVVVPQQAISGARIVYFISYENITSHALTGTRIRLHYPDGFVFSSGEPAPTEDSYIWDIGEVPQSGKGRITVSGALEGYAGDTKKVRAEVGFLHQGRFFPYTDSSFDTVIAPSPLWVSLDFVNHQESIAKLGEALSVRVRYKNNLEVPVKDAVLRLELGGSMFVSKGLATDNGFFDSTRNTILWTPANVKQLLFLNPGQELSVTVRVALKDAFPVQGPDDTNFIARFAATLESINVPADLALNKLSASAALDVKIETAPQITTVTRHQDDVSGMVNAGPLPPKVNSETQFTVHWRVAVPANDIENVEVRSVLPTGVVATGEVMTYYTDAKPTFNATTGEVVWFIPKVSANTGIALPALEAIFQVAVVPSVTQIDQAIELIRKTSLVAVDTFTGRPVSAESPAVGTDKLVDAAADQRLGRVVP